MSVRDPNGVNRRSAKRVAIVIANPTIATTTGWPCGFWWSELTHAYHAFTEQGYAVEICPASWIESTHGQRIARRSTPAKK
jgi:hypothetical protein